MDATTTSTEAPKTTDKSKTEESSVSFDKPVVNNTSALRQRPGSISITAIQENSVQKAVSTEISVNTTSSTNQAFSLSNLEKAWQQF